jgi:hypothetical protein
VEGSLSEQATQLAGSCVEFAQPTIDSMGKFERPFWCFRLRAKVQRPLFLGVENEVERESWMRELGGPVSDASFTIHASPEEILQNLSDHKRTAEYIILPGCQSAVTTLVTTRTSGGKVVGHAVVGSTEQGRLLGAHIEILRVQEGELLQIRTQVHIAIINGSLADLDRAAVREQCTKHSTMAYVCDWSLSGVNAEGSQDGADARIRSSWCKVRRVVLELETVDKAHDLSAPLAHAARRENARLIEAWKSKADKLPNSQLASGESNMGSPVGPLRALDLAAGAIVRTSFNVTSSILGLTGTGGDGAEENAKVQFKHRAQHYCCVIPFLHIHFFYFIFSFFPICQNSSLSSLLSAQ